MTFTLLGLGTAQPARGIDQQSAAATAAELCCHTPQQRRLLKTIYRQSHVQRRGSVLVKEQHDTDASGDSPSDAKPTITTTEATATTTLAQPFDFYPARQTRADRGPTVSQRMNAYARHALPLACDAASHALHHADTSPDQIAHLITVSCTGFEAPGLDIQLIETLGLPRDTTRTMIGFMGCHGAINGLRTAQAMSATGDVAGGTSGDASGGASGGGRVLLCCLELCSLHFQYGWDAQQVVANALFADGAAAVVGETTAESHRACPRDNGKTGSATRSPATTPWRLLATGSYLVPNSRNAMSWSIGDHGFQMTLSSAVPNLVDAHLAAWLTQWLEGKGLTIADVGSWAVHPGGPRVLDAVEHALDLPGDALHTSRQVLAECGNMSSPTVLFILERLRQTGAKPPCVLLAFGPGLAVEAALLA